MDFRTYLQNQANSGNQNANRALQYVGNDFQGVTQSMLDAASRGAPLQGTGVDFPKFYQFNQGPTAQDDLVSRQGGLTALQNLYSQYGAASGQTVYQPGATVVGGSASGGADSGQRNAIANAYDSRVSGLRDLLDVLQGTRQSSQRQVGNLYNTSRANIERARDRGLENLDKQQLTVENSRTRSIRDLSEALRGSQQAFQNRLGTMGAGDSSASDLGAYAFAKLGAQGKTDINMQTQESLGQIGVRRGDLESEVVGQLAELDTWKNNNIENIADQYNQQRQQILNDISSTQSEKAIALADLNTRAVQSLSDLDAYSQSVQNAIAAPTAPAVQPGAAAQQAQNLQVNPVRANFGLTVNPQQGGNANPQRTAPGLALQPAGRDDELQSANIASLLQGGRRNDRR